MRPSPRMLTQRLVPSNPARLFVRSLPYEAYPLCVLIVGMLSFGGFTAARLIHTDQNLRLARSHNAGSWWAYEEERAKVEAAAAAARAVAGQTPVPALPSASSPRH